MLRWDAVQSSSSSFCCEFDRFNDLVATWADRWTWYRSVVVVSFSFWKLMQIYFWHLKREDFSLSWYSGILCFIFKLKGILSFFCFSRLEEIEIDEWEVFWFNWKLLSMVVIWDNLMKLFSNGCLSTFCYIQTFANTLKRQKKMSENVDTSSKISRNYLPMKIQFHNSRDFSDFSFLLFFC